MQIIESDIVELGSANILRKQGIQNKRPLSLRVQQSDDMRRGGGQEGSAHPSQEVQTLLCLLDQCRSVHRPGEVVCDVHSQELGAADHLHSRVAVVEK